jgi:hypothetical protein
MSASKELKAFSVGSIRVSVHRTECGVQEIRLQYGDAKPFCATPDDVARLRKTLEQAELFARYQQQLGRQWCPSCGEEPEL